MSLEFQASVLWLLLLAVMLSPLSSQADSGMCISSSLSDSACVTVAELMMAQEGEYLMGAASQTQSLLFGPLKGLNYF